MYIYIYIYIYMHTHTEDGRRCVLAVDDFDRVFGWRLQAERAIFYSIILYYIVFLYYDKSYQIRSGYIMFDYII